MTARIPASAWQARSGGLWGGPLAVPGRGVRPPGCQGPPSVGERPAYWRWEERHGRSPAVRSLSQWLASGSRLCCGGTSCLQRSPGMLGTPPHWPRGTVAGPRLAGGIKRAA